MKLVRESKVYFRTRSLTVITQMNLVLVHCVGKAVWLQCSRTNHSWVQIPCEILLSELTAVTARAAGDGQLVL